MLEALRKAVFVPSVPTKWVEGGLVAATVGAFVWLLVEGAIQPLAVLLLELYLLF